MEARICRATGRGGKDTVAVFATEPEAWAAIRHHPGCWVEAIRPAPDLKLATVCWQRIDRPGG